MQDEITPIELDRVTGGTRMVRVGDGELVPANKVDELVCGKGWKLKDGGCHKK